MLNTLGNTTLASAHITYSRVLSGLSIQLSAFKSAISSAMLLARDKLPAHTFFIAEIVITLEISVSK
ncbi:MAG: hypothetical protein WCS87_18910 [Methylococcaceae bacterium]